ncbi:acetyl-CoA acetyltransferase [Afifella sp. IM 167]|uniref:acetyl-CoA acetyltransferase n=1 Tax=Afifella sp. IM 167 TaxID=2033586 RepID=UPI001CCE99B8|nr:acetyl-CoA acetyltransferase [Afifella sp. IM 167]MBZ8134795.1 thiolase [Afifella sp. IM 167]
MSASDLRCKAAFVGAGLAGMGLAPGYTHLDILGEAVAAALEDAGIDKSEVDGLFTANMDNILPTLVVGEYLGIRPKVALGTNTGGNSFVDHALWAAMALEQGLCNVAVICYGSVARTGGSAAPDQPPYEMRYRPREPISSYAFAAARHMHEYGTTREDLASVAVSARKWAAKNPLAFARDPLSVEDVLASRMISDPLSLLDCCLVTDGAGAVVMVRADRARDARQSPVYLLGCATAQTHRQISQMPDLTVTPAAESGPRAFQMAGLKPADVDVLQLYDAFTINVLLFLEDLGFCKKGEAGALVAGGAIAPGGDLPVNTNGGGLACVHPGMYGIFTLVEGITQLRGAGGERQVEGAEVALCHGNGGLLSCQTTALLGAASVL